MGAWQIPTPEQPCRIHRQQTGEKNSSSNPGAAPNGAKPKSQYHHDIHQCQHQAFVFCERGEGAEQDGQDEVRPLLPVNPSGGLKAKGHPIGATGVSMHAIAAMQLTGTAGAMQLPRADVAGVFNMGGAAVANYVSVLEALR